MIVVCCVTLTSPLEGEVAERSDAGEGESGLPTVITRPETDQ